MAYLGNINTLAKDISYNRDDVVVEFYSDADCTNKLATCTGHDGTAKFRIGYSVDGSTMLIVIGFTLKDVLEWLGHSDIKMMANTYSHLDLGRKTEIGDSLVSKFVHSAS